MLEEFFDDRVAAPATVAAANSTAQLRSTRLIKIVYLVGARAGVVRTNVKPLARRISSQLPAHAGHKNLARRFPSIRGAEDAIASSAPELALAG